MWVLLHDATLRRRMGKSLSILCILQQPPRARRSSSDDSSDAKLSAAPRALGNGEDSDPFTRHSHARRASSIHCGAGSSSRDSLARK